jgi:phosphomannomutase
MITASHNPPRYNGIKLKAGYGGSATPAETKLVEQHLAENLAAGKEPLRMELEQALERGWIERFDPFPAYRKHLHSLVDFEPSARQTCTPSWMPCMVRRDTCDLLAEAGAEVEICGDEPGFNGSTRSRSPTLAPLIEEVTAGGYDLGLAMDGDADRTGAVGPTGRFIDPHSIMALTLRYLVGQRGQRGSVVKTVSTTQMLNRLADAYGLKLHETPVGFNHISDLMLTDDVLIGGEESGGISIKGHIPEGDGVLMGMLLAEMVARSGKSPEELLNEVMTEIGPFYYARNDFHVRPFHKSSLVESLVSLAPAEMAGIPVASVNTRDGVKYLLADSSWLLIRPSGTEPVLRVYAEAKRRHGESLSWRVPGRRCRSEPPGFCSPSQR